MSQTSKERIGQIGKKMARSIFPTDTSNSGDSERNSYYYDSIPDDKNNNDSVNILIKMLRFMNRIRKEEKEESKIRKSEFRTYIKISEQRSNTLLNVFKTEDKKEKPTKSGGFSVLAAAGIVGVGLLASKDAFASIKIPDYDKDFFTDKNEIPNFSSMLKENEILKDFTNSFGNNPMNDDEGSLLSESDQQAKQVFSSSDFTDLFSNMLKKDEKETPEKKSLVTKIMESLSDITDIFDIDSFNDQMKKFNFFDQTEKPSTGDKQSSTPISPVSVSGEIGSLSQKYESGVEGSMAVGRDKSGGTSYGKYQIASKVGSMDGFLKILQKNDADAYNRLVNAGPQDAGVQGQFAQEWKKLASEGRVQKSERQYVVEKIFKPAVAGLKDQEMVKMISENKGLQEMMFSMSVQHGPAGAPYILNKVYRKGMTPEQLVEAAYTERGAEGGRRYFGNSTEKERRSVVNRFVREKGDVRSLLGQSTTPETTTESETTALDTTVQQPQVGTINKEKQKTSSTSATTTIVQNNVYDQTTTAVSSKNVSSLPVMLQLSRQIG